MAQVNPRLWKLPGQRTKRKAWGFTAPSWAVQRGASLQEVKDLLGHHSLAMALRYGHLAPEHLSRSRRKARALASDVVSVDWRTALPC